jgi:hypothetical protein
VVGGVCRPTVLAARAVEEGEGHRLCRPVAGRPQQRQQQQQQQPGDTLLLLLLLLLLL